LLQHPTPSTSQASYLWSYRSIADILSDRALS
jgi:hypothetical protein